MTIVVTADRSTVRRDASRGGAGIIYSPFAVRAILILAIAIMLAVGFFATGAAATAEAVSDAGPDLTRLLRAMAAIKMLMAGGAAAAVLWRLGSAVSLPWFAAYVASGAVMAAGPGLIWGMAHVGMGALLLHGGLVVTIVLLWRDRAVTERLAALVAARRTMRARNESR